MFEPGEVIGVEHDRLSRPLIQDFPALKWAARPVSLAASNTFVLSITRSATLVAIDVLPVPGALAAGVGRDELDGFGRLSRHRLGRCGLQNFEDLLLHRSPVYHGALSQGCGRRLWDVANMYRRHTVMLALALADMPNSDSST